MALRLKGSSALTAPVSGQQKSEMDPGIITGVTRAAFDWSNTDWYTGGTANIVAGTTFANMVSGSTDHLTVDSASPNYLPPVSGGLIPVTGGSSGGAGTMSRASSMAFPTTARRMLITFWMYIPPLETLFATASALAGIMGVSADTTSGATAYQWSAFLQSDASKALSAMQFRFFTGGTANTVIGTTLNGSALTGLAGGVHQFGLYFEIDDDTGTGTGRIYVDKVLKATGTPGAITQPQALGALPSYQVFICPQASGLKAQMGASYPCCAGRIMTHDLTSRPDFTVAQILAREARGAQGYLS